jgi:hypothetical protein
MYQVNRSNKNHPSDADSMTGGEQPFYYWDPRPDDPKGQDGSTSSFRHNATLTYVNGLFYCVYRASAVSEDTRGTALFFSTSANGIDWDNHGCISPMAEINDTLQLDDWNGDAWKYGWVEHPWHIFKVPGTNRVLVRYTSEMRFRDHDNNTVRANFIEVRPDGTAGPAFLYEDARFNPNDGVMWPDFPSVDDMDQEIADGAHWFMQYATPNAYVDVDEYTHYGDCLFDGPTWLYHYHRWFTRPDGVIVGINEDGVALTSDSGRTWTQKASHGLSLNFNAKLFLGWNSNDVLTLVGNVSGSGRAPAVLMRSSDGITFDTLMTPVVTMNHKKYSGGSKTSGFNYADGPTEGFTDPMPDGDFWYVITYNKEEVWVGRVEVPITSGEKEPVWDSFEGHAKGSFVAGWNVHRPVWCPTDITAAPDDQNNNVLRIRDEDPWDRAVAERVFPESTHAVVQFEINPSQDNTGYASPVKEFPAAFNWEPYTLGNWLEIEVQSWNHQRPVRLYFATDGKLKAVDGSDTVDVMDYAAGQWYTIKIEADCNNDTYTLWVDGQEKRAGAAFADTATTLERLTFRTGKYVVEDGPSGSSIGYAACSDCGDLPHANDPVPLQEWFVDDVNLLEASAPNVTVIDKKRATHSASSVHEVKMRADRSGLQINSPCDGIRVILFNADGTVVGKMHAARAGTYRLDVRKTLATGMYFVKITRGAESVVRRAMVL